jgi:hypothetical protein
MMDFEQVRALINQRLSDGSPNEQLLSDEPSEEAFIELIAQRVAELMESNMELFINHLYRMDVDEKKVNQILLHSEYADESVYKIFARLIYQRQKERLETRKKYKRDPDDFWAES